jgi:hypothetical protein
VSRQLLPILGATDHEWEEDPFVSTGGEEMGSIARPEAQRVSEVLAVATSVPLSGVGELGPPPKMV